MTRQVRVAVTPARVAAKTAPVPAGRHLARQMPLGYARGVRRRLPLAAGLVGLVPVVLVVVGLTSGAFGV